MKRIVTIAIIMMAAASLKAQSVYAEPSCTPPETNVHMTGDSISVSWFSDDPITELRYRYRDSVDWKKKVLIHPTCHFTLTIPLPEVERNVEYVLVYGNHHRGYSVYGEVILPEKSRVEYGYRTDNSGYHPMW